MTLKVAVIIGSTRDGRYGTTVADWFGAQARQRADMTFDMVDAAEAALPHAFGSAPAPGEMTARLAAADAFVVITPEYNHSYPGGLKNLIDLHRAEWQAKPVAFVSYGGMSGGLRAVEHLRGVFAELHTVTVRDTVSFHNAWGLASGGGPDGCEAAAKTMLDQLAWWGTALREARAARPYGA
ncbi:NADPH-dependent FMN reductase [Actinomadura macrotermitis]|uniref:2-hydroxy-1,4-benzoquinone reductase n=1 Tax=Actinomadura macrotermitis TaxID=2585200 RepID=A0A7K0BWW8_9ACTN|nr:NAD(P)H-dependent oxidoreductase [Actinomadura macrotermitis]MQY05174.1 2-hydroxy-1,4-benzoquinone reductase [Actinomadura macrotermitis]